MNGKYCNGRTTTTSRDGVVESVVDAVSGAPIEGVGGLPKLPEAGYAVDNVTPVYYTADQMRKYARLAMLAERERWAQKAEARALEAR